MGFAMKGKSCLRLFDFSVSQIEELLLLAANLKSDKKAGVEKRRLQGMNIALLFEKTSTRTRCAFEVAAHDQGAATSYLELGTSQIGKKESFKDSARVLGRMYDGIQFRGYSQRHVEELASHAGVPVWNGLTDEFHPTQILADLLTIKEHLPDKKLREIKIAYVGDGRNNMGNSFVEAAALMGLDLRIVAPKEYWPSQIFMAQCASMAQRTGAEITLTESISEGVMGVDFVYTDVWVSMGESENVWEERIKKLLPYQVNSQMLEKTKNPDVKFLHCLPAFHNEDTGVGKEILDRYGLASLEVTEEVFESRHSVVFDQAENRLHTIKSLLVATLA